MSADLDLALLAQVVGVVDHPAGEPEHLGLDRLEETKTRTLTGHAVVLPTGCGGSRGDEPPCGVHHTRARAGAEGGIAAARAGSPRIHS